MAVRPSPAPRKRFLRAAAVQRTARARSDRADRPTVWCCGSGFKIASWGETDQVDFTFSAAKSYLSLLAGIAVTDGLIADLDEPVRRTVDDGGFDSAQNRAITWRHLLQNTSEWHGELFGKSDRIDWNRKIGIEGKGPQGRAASPASTRHALGI